MIMELACKEYELIPPRENKPGTVLDYLREQGYEGMWIRRLGMPGNSNPTPFKSNQGIQT